MGDFEDKLRAGFDAEEKQTPLPPNLRYRVIAKAVATPRRRRIGAWLTVPRLVTVGAAAAVLLAAGVGLRAVTQSHPITAQHSPTPSAAVLAFGKLPPASLRLPQGLGGGGNSQTVVPYFGPATMTWTGQLPPVPSSAPVTRFAVPSVADADALASRFGATLTSPGNGPEPRTYRMPGGYTLSISLNDPAALEPTFIINYRGALGGGSQTEATARTAADAALTQLGLKPSWPSAVTVSTIGTAPLYVIQYQHVIQVSTGVTAGEVDGTGDPSGIQVVIDPSGKAVHITGPVRLAGPATAQSQPYPITPPSQLVNAAVSAAPQVSGEGAPPQVALTKVVLVYTVVTSNGTGYLEPAYLFTGTFSSNGVTQEKRVLVPALQARALS